MSQVRSSCIGVNRQRKVKPSSMNVDKMTFGFGRPPLAPYACNPDLSRGRLFPQTSSPTRTEFQRDRDRIIHSSAFRRLQYKTQVFVFHEGDHYRTRLTHTLEVAQISRSLARALRLDEDLAESLALAHDLGHSPFGHPGEDALEEAMSPFGGFDHNAQSLRIVTKLERRYAEYDGLNLTFETLEGLVKHNGPLIRSQPNEAAASFEREELPFAVRAYGELQDLELATHASLEAQAAAIADDIAYNAHDIDDGLRAGMFTLSDLSHIPQIQTILQEINQRYPGLDSGRAAHELVRRIITMMVEDVINSSIERIGALTPNSLEDVRQCGSTLVKFSPQMELFDRSLKKFLFAAMYREKRQEEIRKDAQSIILDLFQYFFNSPAALPGEWKPQEPFEEDRLARRVCDFIAGMTDRFALETHRSLFDATPTLR